jgi:CBS domain containing-hemolysin-like protein
MGSRGADQAEEIIQSTSYQGFPVVRGEFDKTIVGMVSKTELRYALGEWLPHVLMCLRLRCTRA